MLSAGTSHADVLEFKKGWSGVKVVAENIILFGACVQEPEPADAIQYLHHQPGRDRLPHVFHSDAHFLRHQHAQAVDLREERWVLHTRVFSRRTHTGDRAAIDTRSAHVLQECH